jgi:hypothetical protein
MKAHGALGLACVVAFGWAVSCTAGTSGNFGDGTGAGQSGGQAAAGGHGAGMGGLGIGGDLGDAGSCERSCSGDMHQVIDCNGNVIEQCAGLEGCDLASGTCINACEATTNNKQSVGCEYYATDMSSFSPTYCFAAFVANTWNTPVHITVDYQGQSLSVGNFARIPSGQGATLSYSPYDPVAGLPPNEVAILFLAGTEGGVPDCPVAGAMPSGTGASGTAIFDSFRIGTDVPVVAYQINPYGGGNVAVTGASLLIPTSAWDVNYIAVNAYRDDISGPSMNIIAAEDNTNVTMLPIAAVVGGGTIPASPANQAFTFLLNRGQQAQIEQTAELTGSVLQSDKPIGFMAGHPCMRVPYGVPFCDHGEQMIPPVKALGHEYVGVMYRPRQGEPAIWRVIGAVDGTVLTWTPAIPPGAPVNLNRGMVAEFNTGTPFVVESQDEQHPFLMFTYMSGSQWNMLSIPDGYGDADWQLNVPPEQFMSAYVFFADPTYPETNLVVIRAPMKGQFYDVTLDCAGVLGGWQPVGAYEWTRADLITGNFQNVGNCSTGRHTITSPGPFGLGVWGWGTPLTAMNPFTANVSYSYPGGMNVLPINPVVIPPIPE